MLPFVVIRLPVRDVSGGKTAPSMELARLTLDGVMCHDLGLGGGVCATKHFWYCTWGEDKSAVTPATYRRRSGSAGQVVPPDRQPLMLSKMSLIRRSGMRAVSGG